MTHNFGYAPEGYMASREGLPYQPVPYLGFPTPSGGPVGPNGQLIPVISDGPITTATALGMGGPSGRYHQDWPGPNQLGFIGHPLPPAARTSPPAPSNSPPASPAAIGGLLEQAFGIPTDRFNVSFQVWIQIQGKRKKPIWENIKESNLRLLATDFLPTRTLRSFKKVVAASCFYKDDVHMARTILGYEKEDKLVWLFHINGTVEFARTKNIRITTDETFEAFLEACSTSTKTMGVRILMQSPRMKAGERKRNAAVRSSLKRANRQYVPSSDGTVSGVEGSHELSESDCSLEHDDTQDLANACAEIRKGLVGGNVSTGEAPYCADPGDSRRKIRVTLPLLKLWARDLVDQVPEVTSSVPPMSRQEFKGNRNKRTCWGTLDDQDDQESARRLARRSFPDKNMDRATALQADVSMVEFLHFANIREEAAVQALINCLDELGIDHWTVFLNENFLEVLKDAGVDFGTRQKLVIAAPAYEGKLSAEAMPEYD